MLTYYISMISYVMGLIMDGFVCSTKLYALIEFKMFTVIPSAALVVCPMARLVEAPALA